MLRSIEAKDSMEREAILIESVWRGGSYRYRSRAAQKQSANKLRQSWATSPAECWEPDPKNLCSSRQVSADGVFHAE